MHLSSQSKFNYWITPYDFPNFLNMGLRRKNLVGLSEKFHRAPVELGMLRKAQEEAGKQRNYFSTIRIRTFARQRIRLKNSFKFWTIWLSD